MKIVRSKDFRPDRAWGALDIANMNGITTRRHWTDQPYRWHLNDGDVFFADVGCEHAAHPQGEARILVIERAGSV
jgi:hypothetical protein